MAREPDFIFRYGDGIQDFARYVKISKTGRFIRSISSPQANRFWSKIEVAEVAGLVAELEQMITEYHDDIEGFGQQLSRFQLPRGKSRSLIRTLIEQSNEPIGSLVLEINTWRLPFAGGLNLLGNPASNRRSMIGSDGRRATDAANAIAVWDKRMLLSGKTQFVRV